VCAGGDQLVAPDLLGRVRVDALELARPRDLERGDIDVPFAVALDIEERIGNGQRHLVPKLGRAHGVSEDEDVGHAVILDRAAELTAR